MIQAKCIQKFRDKNNQITGYRLQGTNGETRDTKPDILKQAIINKQIHVVNLTLTSDNRLVDVKPLKIKLQSKSKNINLQSKSKNRRIGIINGIYFTKFVDEQELIIHIPNTVKELNDGIINKIRDNSYEGKIIVKGGQSLENTSNMFYECGKAHIDISMLDTSRVKNMSSMFEGCEAGEINFGDINTANVNNMKKMFSRCTTQVLDLRNFEVNATSNSCIDLTKMFDKCKSTTIEVDMSKFIIDNDNIESIFCECKSTFKPEEFKNKVIEFAKKKHIHIGIQDEEV